MRKVLSFVLVLSLVLGSLGMAFAAPMSDVQGEDFEDAVNVLTELGVVTGYPDGTYRPENIVTRAEMAVIVVRALGLADYAVGTANFKDMAGHWSNPYVAYANALGVIAGYPDGTFRPDRTVSYDEAATMLVAALGYTPESLVGTWPANYVVKAKSLGILDGIVAGSAGANRGDIATMAFQTLDQEIGRTNADGDWEGAKTAGKEDTMLKRLGAKVYDPDANGEAQPFLVTKDIADEAIANLMPYIGAWVTAYMNSDEDIIAIKEVKSVFLTGSYKSNGKFKADGVEYSYDAKLTKTTAAAIVNAQDDQVTGASIKPTNTATLAVNLSGKTIKDVYSVATWAVTEEGFFKAADAADIAEDDSLFDISFATDNNGDLDTKSFALFGAAKLSDIPKDSVVYVYALDDVSSNKIVRIEVGTGTVEGKVTRVSDDDYTIGGKVYTDAGFTPSGHITPKAGDEVKAYLDYSGDVYKFEKLDGGTENYAVVINLAKGEPGLNGTTPKIKMLLADGTSKTFTADQDEVANAILGTNRAWTDAITTGAIVEYGLDKDGLVDEIVTTNAIFAGPKDVTAKGYFNGYKVADDAVIFTATTVTALVTAAGTDVDDYGVTTLKDILDTKDVNARYVLDDGVIVAMIIQDDATIDDEVFGVAIDYALNDSDAKHEIEFLIDGKAVVYNAKTAAYDAAVTTTHALYLLVFDTAGNVKDLGELDSANTNAIATATEAGNNPTLNGYVVEFTTVAAVTGAGVTKVTTEALTLDSDVVVYKWNATSKVYKKGTLRDIESTGATVVFFDVYDEDLVYDIVLVN